MKSGIFTKMFQLALISCGLWLTSCADDASGNKTGSTEESSRQTALALITAPQDNTRYHSSASITFNGSTLDSDGGEISGAQMQWSSDIDGVLGVGSTLTRTLTPGLHTIVLTVTTTDDIQDQAEIHLTVNHPPQPEITAPLNGDMRLPDDIITFSGLASDVEDATIPGDQLQWISSIDGIVGSGPEFTTTLSAGSHTITFRATDSAGESATAALTLIIDTAPNAKITAIDKQIAQGLVLYYPFTGNAQDASGNAINGVVYGATLTTDRFGNPDSAYNFDGASYIRAPADLLPIGERTVALWFNARRVDSYPVLLGYGGGTCGTSWFMGLNDRPDGNVYYMSTHCKKYHLVYPYTESQLNTWHHFVVTTDAVSTRLYRDGVQIAVNNLFVDNTNVAGKQLALGVDVSPSGLAPYTDGNVGYLDGKLDEVRIYDRALTTSEISNLYRDESTDFNTRDIIHLTGTGTDAEDGDLAGQSLVWRSSIDGELGTGTAIEVQLSAGEHVISLTVTDSSGVTTTVSAMLTVTAIPPAVQIVTPESGAVVEPATMVNFTASATDATGTGLPGSALIWTSSIDGELGIGSAVAHTLSEGYHEISVTATDGDGLSTTWRGHILAARQALWSRTSGGNEHTYGIAWIPDGITWTDASNISSSLIDDWQLAALTSATENDFAYNLASSGDKYWKCCIGGDSFGPWLGASYVGPGVADYQWLTGEAFNYALWAAGEPAGDGSRLVLFGAQSPMGNTWNDIAPERKDIVSFLIEKSNVPTLGLIAYYPFHGDATDESANRNNGIVHGATLTTDRFGAAGNAYDFNGVDNYIDIGNDTSIKPPLPVTISLWVAWDDTDAGHIFVNNWGNTYYYGVWLQVNPDGSFGVTIGNGGFAAATSRKGRGSTGATLTRGQWHHVAAVVRSVNDMDVYLDGVNVSGDYSGSATGMVYNSSAGTMGYLTVTSNYFYKGKLDDVRFYNRALSDGEITKLAKE